MSHQNEPVYRLPSLIPNETPSNSNSLNSGHQISYWKASSQSPITSTTLPPVVTHRERVRHFLAQFWQYAVWPIALLIVCITVGAIVYFLLAQNQLHDSNSSTHSSHNPPFQRNNDRNAINFSNNYNSMVRRNRTQNGTQPPAVQTTFSGDTSENDGENYFTKKLLPSTPLSTNVDSSTTTVRSISTRSPLKKILLVNPATTNTPSGTDITSTVKNVKIYTNSGERRKLPQPAPKHTTLLLPADDDSDDDNVVERSKLLFPSKETFENFGFTSGHQNNFGVPIEEDERILRMLNDQMLNSQRKLNQSDEYFISSHTTDANVYQTKVSPTLPNLKKNLATTERIRARNASIDDGNYRHVHSFSMFFFFLISTSSPRFQLIFLFFICARVRHLSIDNVATMPRHFTIWFNKCENGQTVITARFGAFSIYNRIQVLVTGTRIYLFDFGTGMPARAHGTIITVQTNL